MSEEQKINAWADDPAEKEMLADSESGGGRTLMHIKFKEGRNAVRIVGKYYAFREVWFNKPIERTAIFDGKNSITETDPRIVKLRDEASALSEKHGKEDSRVKDAWKKAFKWRPKLKYAVNVIDRADGLVKIWKFSRTMKEEIMAIITEHDEPIGYDLIVNRTGQKLKTRYKVSPAREREPLTAEEKELKPFVLSRIFKATPVETVKAYMDGKVPEKKASTTTTAVVEKDEVVENPTVPDGVGDGLDEMGDLGDI